MTSRRSFLVGAVASSVAIGVSPVRATGLTRHEAPALVVIDRSLEGADSFVRRAMAHEADVLAFSGDISRLWLDQLAPALCNRPAALMGFTRAGALFCLERWGWGAGLRVVHRIDHVPDAAGGWTHVPAFALAEPARLGLDVRGHRFRTGAADLCFAARAHRNPCTHTAAPQGADRYGEPAVSWTIAPISV